MFSSDQIDEFSAQSWEGNQSVECCCFLSWFLWRIPQNPGSHSWIRVFPVVRLCVWMFVDLCRTLKLLWGSTCWWTDSRGTRLQTWKVLPVGPAGPVLVPLRLTRMSSSDEEALDLESLLDDSILDTAWRRHSYPKRILPHVVHALKAERKVLVGSVQPTSWDFRVT